MNATTTERKPISPEEADGLMKRFRMSLQTGLITLIEIVRIKELENSENTIALRLRGISDDQLNETSPDQVSRRIAKLYRAAFTAAFVVQIKS